MDIKVIVVGAGPAGCFAALALKNVGVSVEVFERDAAPQGTVPGRGGGALLITGGGEVSFQVVGVPMDDLYAVGGKPLLGLEFFWGQSSGRFTLNQFAELGLASRIYRRADVAKVLREMVDKAGITVTNNAKVASVTEDGTGVTINFIDGRMPARASLVIACDGMNSNIRHQMLGHEQAKRTPFNQMSVGWFARVPSSGVGASELKTFAEGRAARFYSSASISGTTCITVPYAEDVISLNLFCDTNTEPVRSACERHGVPEIKGAPPTAVMSIVRELMGEYLFKMHPELVATCDGILTQDDGTPDLITANLTHIIKPEVVSKGGRVLLIGDAGWPTHPNNGVGLNMAFEFTASLALMIKNETQASEALPKTTKRWATFVMPRLLRVMAESRQNNTLASCAGSPMKFGAMKCLAPCLVRYVLKEKFLWPQRYQGKTFAELASLIKTLPKASAVAAAYKAVGISALKGGTMHMKALTAPVSTSESISDLHVQVGDATPGTVEPAYKPEVVTSSPAGSGLDVGAEKI